MKSRNPFRGLACRPGQRVNHRPDAVCIDGQNACPPEDCGGIGGYERFREVLADPTDEEHEHYTEWIGGTFDPERFDLVVVNAALQRVH